MCLRIKGIIKTKQAIRKKEAELTFNRSEEGKKLNSLLAAADKRLKQESAKVDTEEAILTTKEAILATERDIDELSTQRGRKLIQLEKDYHDANIIFMSVSVDVENAKQKWIDMINEKDMGGVQLISTDGWNSQIIKDYAINSIPRFMLFDREGNVISVDAPRPSSDEIRKIFMSFEIVEGLESEGIEVIEVIDGPKEL